MKKLFPVIIIVLLILVAVFIVLTSEMSEDNNPDDVMMEKDDTVDNDIIDDDISQDNAVEGGIYTEYDFGKLTDDKNVLFFHAPWCPTCSQLNRNINANLSSIPEDVTILKTDYDSETELKKKYGITYQHTLVQVDQQGNMIKKWSGSFTVDEIVDQIV